jgi:DNA-binding CsgD family transcriptional regulator
VQLTEPLLVAYVFTALVVGTSCVGAAMVLARLRHDDLAHLFLWFYLPCSVLVLSGLLLALMDMQATVSPATRSVLEYLESFVGRYGVMLALPLFVHRLFDVRSRRRDAILVAIVLVTLVAQHVTEFALGGSVWDARGDAAEDAVSGSILAYALFVAVTRRKQGVYPPFARRFLALFALGTPLIVFDVFVVEGPGLRLFPLLYCVAGVVLVLTLVGRHTTTGVAPREWKLSDREEDVLRLVQRGLSTQAIAGQLTISPNTVKTHLRAIFDKSGFRTRAALIAHTRPPPDRVRP